MLKARVLLTAKWQLKEYSAVHLIYKADQTCKGHKGGVLFKKYI